MIVRSEQSEQSERSVGRMRPIRLLQRRMLTNAHINAVHRHADRFYTICSLRKYMNTGGLSEYMFPDIITICSDLNNATMDVVCNRENRFQE